MDKLPSSEFRKTFASLTKPVAVTANGHVIGAWHPGVIDPSLQDLTDEVKHLKAELAKRPIPPYTEVERLSGSLYNDPTERFNSRPFTPAPKKGK